MKNLYRYLEKNSFNYKAVTMGSNYFYGYSVSFPAIMVRGNTREINKAENYAVKHGYNIYSGGYSWGNGEFYTIIMRLEDCKILDNYSHFQAISQTACELIIHKYHIGHINYDRMHRETYNAMNYCESKAREGRHYLPVYDRVR